jgi:predicted transcriptional regulator
MVDRQNRSAKYQFIILETAFSIDMLESFSNEDSIYSRLNPFAYDETMLELYDELKVEFWRVVKTLLTPRQREVIELSAQGYTQQEIAFRLKVNQSSVTKAMWGNVDYKKGRRIYGGINRRLKKIMETDEKVLDILARIKEKREEVW